MAGVIWIVQVVHYPLFARVGEAGYAGYQGAHMRLITWVVLPAMAVELASAAYLAWASYGAPGGRFAQVWLPNLALLGLIWLSTAAIQVPQHGALLEQFDASTHAALVRGNWIRTILWSARAVALAWLAVELYTE